eukprot:TRINITY_DN1824_c0_g1_i4.p1 TRINITY_DN1824_c0_g1~~TRINITY_DN1824_c0_g1_i4.p1  ORF type:complete len:118 (-),score=28.13 TRINITY_DN1824_c0_g1_i4:88-405(-)
MTTGIGTPAFMAPEILERGTYNTAADVYSFAILTYQIITEKEPFVDFASVWKISDWVVSGKRLPLDGVPDKLGDIITQCWDPKPQSRPQFKELCTTFEKILAEMT